MIQLDKSAKKRAQIILAVIFVCLPLLITSKHTQPNTVEHIYPNSHDLIDHEPILIIGNEELAAFCTQGSGTFDDKYIIENLLIEGIEGVGIEIHNTDKHVEIRYCEIKNGMKFNCYGINMLNSANVTLRNNTITGKYGGIKMFASRNITLVGNECSENGNGLGFDFYLVENLTITQNTIKDTRYGIILQDATNVNFTKNSLESDGFCLEDTSNIHLDKSNTNHGKPIWYLENNDSIQVNGEDNIGQLILKNCSNSLLTNFSMQDIPYPIWMEKSSNITIHNVNLTRSKTGIYVKNSNNSIISKVTCVNQSIGLHITESSKNNISEILFINTTLAGILLGDSDQNNFSHINITASKVYPFSNPNGVSLWGSSHNIFNRSDITGWNYGMNFEYSDNNTITRCNISGNENGVTFEFAEDNHLKNNSIQCVKSYNLKLRYSPNMNLTENYLSGGRSANIYCFLSDGLFLSNNQLNYSGILLVDSFNHNIDTSNKLNGKSIYYYENQANIIMSGNLDVGQILLVNCEDSIITNLEISEVSRPLSVYESKNITVSNNKYTENYFGLFIYRSTECKISDNIFTHNSIGIFSSGSWKNEIISNNCSDNERTGIWLFESENQTLKNNELDNCGINIEGYRNNDNIIDTSNTINGKPIKYYEDYQNFTLTADCETGQLVFLNCSFGNISDFKIENTSIGIILLSSKNLTLMNNHISNSKVGISLEWSDNNTVIRNNCSFNGIGVELYGAEDNIFSENIFQNNSEFVHWIGDANQWSLNNRGNYWSNYGGSDEDGDGIGDIAYYINFNNIDEFPLINPNGLPSDLDQPIWIISAQSFNLTEITVGMILFDYEAEDNIGIDHYRINDTRHFSINQNGQLVISSIPENGYYNLLLEVFDAAGNVNTLNIRIWVNLPDNNTKEATTSETESSSTSTDKATIDGRIPGYSFNLILWSVLISIFIISNRLASKAKNHL
ncbi:NosD domain-containing protein [Candidatus Lokiarchaeum ossiferum]|uniref:NosD domain-containing protein n=1 Tax=Candidatus Lokiarchaeum ossiferum TaxID=2951803 RepID=UPI00352F10AE